MNPNELGFTLVLVAVLLGLAGYFGWQQVLALRGLASPDVLGADDRRYLRIQAYRRLVCSVLMVVIAGLLVGWLFLEADHRELQKEMRAALAADPAAGPTQEQKDFACIYWFYLVTALLVLMVLLALATMDFWATARFGLSQRRKLQADQKAMLQEQVARWRQQRNGQHGS